MSAYQVGDYVRHDLGNPMFCVVMYGVVVEVSATTPSPGDLVVDWTTRPLAGKRVPTYSGNVHRISEEEYVVATLADG